jgi:hypothetical protein
MTVVSHPPEENLYLCIYLFANPISVVQYTVGWLDVN